MHAHNLKKAVLIAAALIIAAVPAEAMSFRLGGQLGVARTSLMGDLPDEGAWEGRFSFGAGVVADFSIHSDVAISFQPAFTQCNSRQVFYQDGTVYDSVDYDLNYISLPLIVRVTGDPVGVRGFVSAGLNFGILVDATAQTGTGSEDISNGLNSTTIGALFGVGIMLPVKRHFLTFEFRYGQGLDDIVKREDDSTDTGMAGPSVKYRSFGLLVGFLFSLGGE
jgi:hypothetical protein